VRKHGESIARLSGAALARGRRRWPAIINRVARRPRTLDECDARGFGVARPCPFVSCAHHLALDVDARGNVRFNAPWRADVDDGVPELDVGALAHTCALRPPAGGASRDELAAVLGVTRRRVEQLELAALARVRRLPIVEGGHV
jgi:hypothetical protein